MWGRQPVEKIFFLLFGSSFELGRAQEAVEQIDEKCRRLATAELLALQGDYSMVAGVASLFMNDDDQFVSLCAEAFRDLSDINVA
jgi:hypothetical protein